jgi:hypothetical protein
LQAIWEQAGNAGVLDDGLREAFARRGAEIRAAVPSDDEPIEAEIIEEVSP